MFERLFKAAIVAACAAMIIPAAAQAQWWQHHPKYLHAMSNLRTAYWLIAHHEANDPVARPEETAALDRISRAYQNLKDASIVDEKDIRDQPPANMNFWDHRGRLHHALDLLQEARTDVGGEEEDPAARGFRKRALYDIDKAIGATNDAIHAWMF
jgi:hypothetical protein